MLTVQKLGVFLLLSSLLLSAQGTPPDAPGQTQDRVVYPHVITAAGPPPPPSATRMEQMQAFVKQRVKRAIWGKDCPSLDQWRPLSASEKFHVFTAHTYSPMTFLNTAINVGADRVRGKRPNIEYETGFRGIAQQYGIELGTNETDIFFESFLVPTLLRQDPRYFRNPSLPFVQRAFYSMSRVLFTRTDRGRQALNASKLIGGAASQAIGDLYVPGQRQGMAPILGRFSFNLLRDAGTNLAHEFWPDLRHKIFRR